MIKSPNFVDHLYLVFPHGCLLPLGCLKPMNHPNPAISTIFINTLVVKIAGPDKQLIINLRADNEDNA